MDTQNLLEFEDEEYTPSAEAEFLGKYYALQACSCEHAEALAAKSRRQFGEGYQRGTWVIVGPCKNSPWAWREALPAGDWNMYAAETPEAAAERAGIKF